MGYAMYTKSGHSYWEMLALLQGAIRRGDVRHAGYAASELHEKYKTALWNRLMVISAEDCYGIMTKEIVALRQAEEIMKRKDETIFVSKAIVLLCYARKNRDADYFACNLMHSDHPIPPEEIKEICIEDQTLERGVIPNWAFNVHTVRGRQMGKDVVNEIDEDQKALQPLQIGMFDDCSWNRDINAGLKNFNPQRRPIPYDDGKRQP
jgi:hypothetical protein